ncbi:sugar transferase [Sphingomonas sanguinis]|uniref:sugar transferase n=1 Tax=Sphingomonas sanguinis TaxID=33051 RepID=UPI00214BF742|nr:sugar transferase [Sphingomonas sanguinis]
MRLHKAEEQERVAALPGIHRRYGSRLVRMSVYLVQLLLDIISIPLALGGASLVGDLLDFKANRLYHDDVLLILATIPIFMIANFYVRVYTAPAMKSYHVGAIRSLHAWFITLAIAVTLIFFGKTGGIFSRGIFITTAILTTILLLVTRAVVVRIVRDKLEQRFDNNLLIEDDPPLPIEHLPSSFERISTRDTALKPDIHDPIGLSNFSWLVAGYDMVVVSCPAERRGDWALYLQSVGCMGHLLMPELQGIAAVRDHERTHLPTVPVSQGPLDLPDRILKRMLDLAITVPAIIALCPLLLVIAIAVKLDSPGPLLFRQQRMGRSNRLFNVYKFRSMRHESADGTGNRSASRDDSRITRVGRIIRATSVDELPQLFNVLEGDMSLVGPRPHALGSKAGPDLFWHVDQRYWLRHSIKPGITGLAQVRGYRGATDHRDDLTNRLLSDLEYVSDWSIFRDIFILFRTLTVVVHDKAY